MQSKTERYREIVETLSRHGFGFVLGAVGLAGRFPFRHGVPGHEPGRTYRQPEHLRLALEELGATFIKLGQILSTRPDLLPADYVMELEKLQDAVAPVPAQAVVDAIRAELGGLSVFETFDATPLASASIGQAHTATVQGAEVVVKVRRAGVVETVTSDMEILEDLAERVSRRSEVGRDHDVVGIAHDFAATLRKELDYLQEARNAERFAAAFTGDPDVHIPAVFRDLTTSRVLTLERIRGIKISDLEALDAAHIDRRRLAGRAVRVLCKMVFEDGFFHADPHPGNFFVESDGSLGIIDFGMVGELTDRLREQLVALLVHLVRGDADGTTEALLAITAAAKGVDRAALLADVEPVVRRFGGSTLAELALTDLIAEVFDLVRHHRLRLPHDLALLFKMLIMAEGLGQRLDPDFQIAGVLAPYAERLAAERFSPDAVARKIAGLVRDLLAAGSETPRTLRGVAAVLERGGFDVHLRAAELQPVLQQADRIGNRLVAGMIAAALINGVGQIVGGNPGRWSALQRPLLATGAATIGVLGGYLSRRSPTGRRRGQPS